MNARTISFPPSRPLYLACYPNAYIIFPTTVNSFSVSTFYRINHVWHIGDYWITTTKTITVTKWFSANWLNYTCIGAGTQQIHNGTKPTQVYYDGSQHSEGDGWTYSVGTVTLTSATSNAWLYFGNISTTITHVDPEAPVDYSRLHPVHVFVVNGSEPIKDMFVLVGLIDSPDVYRWTTSTDKYGEARFYLLPEEYIVKTEINGETRSRQFVVPTDDYVLLDFSPRPNILSFNIPSDLARFVWLGVIVVCVLALVVYLKGRKR